MASAAAAAGAAGAAGATTTKEQLIDTIKDWIKVDLELVALKAELRERNKRKKALTDTLVAVMKTNEIDCFDVPVGTLVYKKRVVKQPLTRQSLLDALHAYFHDDAELAGNVVQHVMDTRKESVKEVLLKCK